MKNNLQYARPLQEGVDPETIIDFLDACEKARAEIHGLCIAVHDHIIFEAYQAPYDAGTPHLMHSFTKVLTNTAVALAYKDGLLKLENPMLKYFPEEVAGASKYLKHCTLRDLITMRNGQQRSIGGNEWRPLKTSWKEAYFKVPFDKEPGKTFMYSSGNSYILSYIVQQVEGKTAQELFQERVGRKLGIPDFPWMKSPEGVCSGGNGVELTVQDMLRIGLLYLHKGNWKGEQLLPEEWVDNAFGYAHPLPPVDGKQYNFHWERQTGQDIWAAKGMFGQVCGVIPKYDMVFALTAADNGYSAVDLFQETILDRLEPGQPNPLCGGVTPMEKVLWEKGLRMSLLDHDHSVPGHLPLTGTLEYTPEENPDGVRRIRLQFGDGSFCFGMEDDRGYHEIHHGLDCWAKGTTSMTGHYLHHQYEKDSMPVWAEAHWAEKDVLHLKWRYPGMAFYDQVRILFQGPEIIVDRWVNMNSQDTRRPTLHCFAKPERKKG
jgi:CubicO group peptidase (beta-lactamase class C family)